jgi:hypothetical protein
VEVNGKPTWAGACPVCASGAKACPLCHGKGWLEVYGATTAIARRNGSAPCRLLYNRNLLKGRVLDLGSGKNDDLTWLLDQGYRAVEAFDPYHHLNTQALWHQYDTVLCTYVLNVVPAAQQASILLTIRNLLLPRGRAYIAVRRDLPKEGRKGRGVWQRYVKLPLAIEHQDRSFAIYRMGKD